MTESEASDTIDSVLRSDHAAIKRALAHLHGNSAARPSGEVFRELSADVVRHFVAEEQYLLPAVRHHLPDGASVSTASFAEHEDIENMLKKLDDDDTAEERIDDVLAELEAALDKHIEVQEGSLFPALVSASDPGQLAELGRGVLGAEQLAPTHPRSFVPKSATLSKITSWLTGLVEKSLDAREPHDKDR
jgi:iron-sulfur cluster repair protein YtfE (RIC family)